MEDDNTENELETALEELMSLSQFTHQSYLDDLNKLFTPVDVPFAIEELFKPQRDMLQAVSDQYKALGFAPLMDVDAFTHLTPTLPGVTSALAAREAILETLGPLDLQPASAVTNQATALQERFFELSSSVRDTLSIVEKYSPLYQNNLQEIEKSVLSAISQVTHSGLPISPLQINSVLSLVQEDFTERLSAQFAGINSVTSSPLVDRFSSSALSALLQDVLGEDLLAPRSSDSLAALRGLLDLNVETLFGPNLSDVGIGEINDAHVEDSIPDPTIQKRRKLTPTQVFLLQTLLGTLINLIANELVHLTKNSLLQPIAETSHSEQVVEHKTAFLSKLYEFEEFAKPILREIFEPPEYVVLKNSPLRTQADSKSSIEARVFPNTRVQVYETRGSWFYVDYQDDLEGIERMGWIHKKHLQRIDF